MPPTASGSTAVLEYRPTETPPRLGAMLPGFARLCRRYLPARPPKWRKTWASPGAEEEIRRETDCLLEGTGFELLVRGRVKLVVGRRRQRNRTARRSRCRCASVTFDQLVFRTRAGGQGHRCARPVGPRTSPRAPFQSLARIVPGIGIMRLPLGS